MPSASTLSATAAPPASATPARCSPKSRAINEGDLVAAAVLSGNRNFEGRISPDVRANYLASPPLVVAYALAGDMNIDLTTEPLGMGTNGPVYLKDIWPTNAKSPNWSMRHRHPRGLPEEIRRCLQGRRKVAGGRGHRLRDLRLAADLDLHPEPALLPRHVQDPRRDQNITGARVLALLGDMITTDHISPAGSFKASTPAGKYLTERQVPVPSSTATAPGAATTR
jgi:aconitate hydratase